MAKKIKRPTIANTHPWGKKKSERWLVDFMIDTLYSNAMTSTKKRLWVCMNTIYHCQTTWSVCWVHASQIYSTAIREHLDTKVRNVESFKRYLRTKLKAFFPSQWQLLLLSDISPTWWLLGVNLSSWKLNYLRWSVGI